MSKPKIAISDNGRMYFNLDVLELWKKQAALVVSETQAPQPPRPPKKQSK